MSNFRVKSWQSCCYVSQFGWLQRWTCLTSLLPLANIYGPAYFLLWTNHWPHIFVQAGHNTASK